MNTTKGCEGCIWLTVIPHVNYDYSVHRGPSNHLLAVCRKHGGAYIGDMTSTDLVRAVPLHDDCYQSMPNRGQDISQLISPTTETVDHFTRRTVFHHERVEAALRKIANELERLKLNQE